MHCLQLSCGGGVHPHSSAVQQLQLQEHHRLTPRLFTALITALSLRATCAAVCAVLQVYS